MLPKINLLGLTLEQLKSKFFELGLSELDAKRVFPWIHIKIAKSFDIMSDVPLKVREVLKENVSLERPICVALQKSIDGTQKTVLKLEDGNSVETVFIPDKQRNTICISSQVGCVIGCKFCYTGTQNFTRNLTSSEIMSQVFFWKDNIGFPITNIVFMGMGEPLLNHQNLCNSLKLLLSEKTHNFSRNKITVSTSGIIENGIEEIAKFGVKLAISLHASNDSKRNLIMPINKKYNLKSLIAAAKNYLKNSNTDNITFEYLLLKDFNDSDNDATELSNLLNGINCKVNLIVFNSWPGASFHATNRETSHNFLRILLSKGIRTIIRKSRGEDILAACGQLKGSGTFTDFF